LNSDYYFAHEYGAGDHIIPASLQPNTSTSYTEIDPVRTKRLRTIIEETGAKIVLCSSWRSLSDIPEHPQWKYLLSSLAEENLHIYDQTPETLKGRPYDIRVYLDQHREISNYVILDDDYRYTAYRKLGINNLIHTSYWNRPGGLQDDNVKEAIYLLNNNL
jgi:hypothetical protein